MSKVRADPGEGSIIGRETTNQFAMIDSMTRRRESALNGRRRLYIDDEQSLR